MIMQRVYSPYMPVAPAPTAPSDWLTPADEGQLAVDVFRRGSTLVIRSIIAGVDPDALQISVNDDLLTIRGERRHEERIDREDQFLQECYWGAFSRSVLLPEDVDETQTEATLKNGVLEIRLPIRPHGRKIVVRALDEESPSSF